MFEIADAGPNLIRSRDSRTAKKRPAIRENAAIKTYSGREDYKVLLKMPARPWARTRSLEITLPLLRLARLLRRHRRQKLDFALSQAVRPSRLWAAKGPLSRNERRVQSSVSPTKTASPA